MLRTREANAKDFDLADQFFVKPGQEGGQMRRSASNGGGGGGGGSGSSSGHGGMGGGSTTPHRFSGAGASSSSGGNKYRSGSNSIVIQKRSKVWDQQGGRYKYFVVQIPPDADGEVDYDPIVVSVLKGVWCTAPERAEALSNAFLTHDHVFLIFTCDGSGVFQGVARKFGFKQARTAILSRPKN